MALRCSVAIVQGEQDAGRRRFRMAGAGDRHSDSLRGRGAQRLLRIFANAGHEFLEGLSRTLGMDRSLLSLAALVLGLMLLAAA